MYLVTAEEMREIEQKVIEKVGISGELLMENAGASVARRIKERIKKDSCTKIIILSGQGNNGGDGFVIARHLGNAGYNVETWLIGDEKKLSKESKINYNSLVNSGYKVEIWAENKFDFLKENMCNSDVIIDSMLGTGFNGELRQPLKKIIEHSNKLDLFKVAVDMPTGVNSNTGQVYEDAFIANMTVTFALPKVGQLLYPGVHYTGELIIEDISISPAIINEAKIKKYIVTNQMAKNILPIRSLDSHKGTYGHSLIIGGSKNMPGAPSLAAKAALCVGTGLVTTAVPKSIQSLVFSYIPEAICIGLPEQELGHISLNSLEFLCDNNKYNALSFGMGVGLWDEGQQVLNCLLEQFINPIVVDADGLNILSNNLNILRTRKYPTILTPHPGEMSRLIKKSTEYVQQNRLAVAQEFAEKYNTYIVLKGANTIIAKPDGEVYINQTGGPELAKGGTGDVLSGMITGFIAQDIPIKESIIIAVYIHGLAGTLAAISKTNYSTLASDVINNIGPAIHRLMSNHAN